MIFLVLPTGLNFAMAVLLVIYENLHNDKFHEWFRTHTTIASIFTMLGAVNIEMLSFLSSKFAGLEMFSVEYSKKAETLLFWLILLNLIIEDIPQFVIQVI